jgi:hypothetical protein
VTSLKLDDVVFFQAVVRDVGEVGGKTVGNLSRCVVISIAETDVYS